MAINSSNSKFLNGKSLTYQQIQSLVSLGLTSFEINNQVSQGKNYNEILSYSNTRIKATGGVVSYLNGYTYHTFTGTGTFIANVQLSADVLVVAGGGGAGRSNGAAGGGAGGVVYQETLTLPANSYATTIGSGGQASTSTSLQGGDGQNSSFYSITAIGGGGSGTEVNNAINNGRPGGSGGGSVRGSAYNGGAGTLGQGNAGGSNRNDGSPHYAGGGGGGAGANGQDGTSSGGGAGGAGRLVFGSYYGGGGGAGYYNNGPGQATGGAGGIGGGGTGGLNPANGVNGQSNTGGGGGGSGVAGTTGGNGGSGIIIIRYLT